MDNKEQLGKMSEATKKKISKALQGDNNPAYKDGRRSYRRVAGAKPGQHVHHKNNDSSDNRPSNLEKFPEKGPGRAKHEAAHKRENNFKKSGGRKTPARGYTAKQKASGSLKK